MSGTDFANLDGAQGQVPFNSGTSAVQHIGGPSDPRAEKQKTDLGEVWWCAKKRKPRIWHKFWEIEVLVVTAGPGRRKQYEKTEPQAQMLEKPEFYEQHLN